MRTNSLGAQAQRFEKFGDPLCVNLDHTIVANGVLEALVEWAKHVI